MQLNNNNDSNVQILKKKKVVTKAGMYVFVKAEI